MAKGAINVKIEGEYSDRDIKRAIKDLESLKSQGAPAAKSVGGLTTAFKGMALAAGAFVSISAVKDFMGDAISAGSDLEESLSKVNVVFGDSADAVVAWADSSATAFGQSRQQALESVGTFGNLLQAFGSTQAEAQVMSQTMVELAADLASFNNTSVDDALNALRSGLSGETEPLKRFGVAINDARLKAVALEKGLYSGKGTLDVYAKSVAAYELILKDTALAQGDFARTSDGFANQMRILEATVDDAKATIGTEFLIGIESVTEAFGGTDGMTSIVEAAGEGVADFTAGIMLMVEQLGLAVTAVNDFVSVADNGLVDFMLQLDRIFNPVQRLIGDTMAMGAAERDHREAMEKSTAAAEDLYAGYIKYADGAEQASDATYIAEQAAADAETAMKALKDEVNALKNVLSTNQSVDDFAASLRDLDDTLEGNKRTFKGMSDSALENREVLRTAFSDAAGIVQGFVDEGRISESEFADVFAGTGKKIVDDLVAQGFKKKDIKAFLKAEGLWTSELAAVFSASNNREALTESERLGYDIASGISVGVSNGTPQVKSAVSGTVAAAIEAGKKAGKIQSPSQVTRNQIGVPLVDGIIEGLTSKKDKIKSAAADAAQAVIDGAQDRLDEWDQTIADYKDRYDELADYAKGISSSLFGQLDLGAAVDQAKESGGSVVDAFVKQGEAIGTFSQSMIDLLQTGLSQTAWQAINALGAERGQMLADEMLGAQGQATIEGINKVYADVDAMATAVGELAAQKWYGEGVAQAQANYEGFKANYGAGGPARNALMNLMDRLASAMNRTATITVTTINRTINQTVDAARASGGPVAAGKSYLVGEKGPEVLVMGNRSGMIIPNNELPTASGGYTPAGSVASGGKSYNITVQAGVGDPRVIGQQVVEVIRRYESANGRVFAAA